MPSCLPCAHTRYLLSGAKCGKEGLFREMLLLAFSIVALGSVVSIELFVSRAYVASYRAYHIYPRPVFSSEKP